MCVCVRVRVKSLVFVQLHTCNNVPICRLLVGRKGSTRSTDRASAMGYLG